MDSIEHYIERKERDVRINIWGISRIHILF